MNYNVVDVACCAWCSRDPIPGATCLRAESFCVHIRATRHARLGPRPAPTAAILPAIPQRREDAAWPHERRGPPWSSRRDSLRRQRYQCTRRACASFSQRYFLQRRLYNPGRWSVRITSWARIHIGQTSALTSSNSSTSIWTSIQICRPKAPYGLHCFGYGFCGTSGKRYNFAFESFPIPC